MTERDWLVLEAEADYDCLIEDGFTEEEADAIIKRVLDGEDINEIVLEYRPEYAL